MKRLLILVLGAFLLAQSVTAVAAAAEAPASLAALPTAPATKADGKKWRLGYYEGGQYPDYEVILKATVRGLIALGWMQPLDLPAENNPAPGAFWRYLAENTVSDYIEFVPDAYYAAGNFDRARRSEVRDALIARLNEARDIDLMIAMGTWAGQDLAPDVHAVPTVVMSTSDPIGSGIIASAEDSGHDHLHAKVEPDRYARQVELFHDIIGFRKLGLVYEDSPEGRTFAAVDTMERIAEQRGFAIERCFAPFNDVALETATAGAVDCYRRLSETVDAVYLTVHRGLTAEAVGEVATLLADAGLPSFSMLGEVEVKRGVLMSLAQSNYAYVGQFHADTIAAILNGVTPRRLPQVWLAPAKIALNITTAEVIGYDPPVDILMASDEIYRSGAAP